jgi:hypothetical protein
VLAELGRLHLLLDADPDAPGPLGEFRVEPVLAGLVALRRGIALVVVVGGDPVAAAIPPCSLEY